MENIRATFSNLEEMEAAAAMLREQGVIDINLQSQGTAEANQGGNAGVDALDLMSSSLTNGIGDDEASVGTGFIMEVVVESSRFRKVEDTIARCGGQYEGMTLS